MLWLFIPISKLYDRIREIIVKHNFVYIVEYLSLNVRLKEVLILV